MRRRLKNFSSICGGGTHWPFPGQKVDPKKIDELKPLLEQSPFSDRIPEILLEAHGMFDEAPVKRLSES